MFAQLKFLYPYAFQVTNWVNNMSKFESLEKYFLKVISKEGFFHFQVSIIFFSQTIQYFGFRLSTGNH